MNVTFDMPWLLLLALLLPAAAITLALRADRARRRRVARMGTESVVMRLIPPAAMFAPRWRIVRLAVAGLLIGIAAAGPRWGYERTIVRSRGIDMVLALDASLSMMAPDERPNRMERMKQEVRRLRDASPGDRVGLLAFAGQSYILSPLTVDVGALDLFLDNLDPTVVGQAGSSLAKTIKQGIALLKLTNSGADRALVVMSDGEAFEPIEEVEAEAKAAQDNGISLVTVGFGTTKGANIPIEENGAKTFKRDDQGQIVVTQYHPEFLQAAATAAGGTFIDAGVTDKAGQIKRALATLRTQARVSYSGENRVLRFQWFLLPGLLLLMLDTLLAERRGKRPLRPAAANAAAAALLLTVPGCSLFVKHRDAVDAYHRHEFAQSASLFRHAVEQGDKDPKTLYNYGTALTDADSLASAAEVLDRLANENDLDIRHRSLFNLGLSHLKRGLGPPDSTGSAGTDAALDAALGAYKKALLMRPEDMDAKWNYELALRKKQQNSGGGGGGGESQDKSQSNSQQQQQPKGGLGERQADQLLGSAAREERDVQAKKQKENRVEPPPGGKSW